MKTITNIVYNFVRKLLAKNNMGQGKGITSLPNAADIEIGMTDVYNNLRKGGLDAVSAGKAIKSEDDLARTLSEIKQKEISDQQFFNQDPNRLDTIMDKMNKGLPLNEGDRFALEGSGFKTDMDAFKGFEPKVIQGGKSKGIEKLLESGDVKKGVAPKTTKETIKRKSMIDPKLTEEENIKKIMEENKAAAKRLEEKMKDPDKKAEGGLMRLGFEKGGMSRRGFMKLMGGLAALPVVGKFFKPAAKVAETAGPVVQEGVKLGYDKFLMLVDKIKRLGKPADNLATKEREIVIRYDGKDGNEYELVEDLTTGDIRVTKDKVGVGSSNDRTFDTIEDRSTFVLRRNKVDENTKGKKPPDEYEEMREVAYDGSADGTFDDIDEVSDTAVKEVLEELGETKIKKAGGGLAYMLGM